MTVILDNYTIDKVGWIDLNVQFAFELRISGAQAQQNTQRWLHDYSLQLVAALPTLVIGDRPCWRIPIVLNLPQQAAADVMMIDVDAQTGIVVKPDQVEQRLLECLAQQGRLSRNATPFKPQPLPSNYHAKLQPQPHFAVG